MDRSVRRLPHPVPGASNGERRRSVRQKLHSPVYASFNGPETGLVVDLSELLDLHEDGFAVQTSERLETNRAVTLCLELPETNNFIHGSGQVIWSDDAGRGGIRFCELPESSRKILKEWLFANLMIACSNYSARMEQLARREREELSGPISDRNAMLSPVEAVRREVREMGGDLDDAVLQLIAERALSLTGATGAALAFLTDDRMVCRARAGAPAPPLGAPIDLRQGLSGECVLTGRLVSCEDAENDPRVAPEVARAQDIGSLMAVPIVSDFRVLGLIEVFSPHPCAFTSDHATVLHRLVEMVPKIHPEKTQPELVPAAETGLAPSSETKIKESGAIDAGASNLDSFHVDSIYAASIHATREALREPKPEVPGQASEPVRGRVAPAQVPQQVPKLAPKASSRVLHLGLLFLTSLAVALALGYLAGSMVQKYWAHAPQAAQRSAAGVAATVPRQPAADQPPRAKPLAELQMLADRGDADAQWQMGVRYHNGEDVPQNDAQAIQWFLRAAQQGHVPAQATLGAYYWAGRGVPEDLSQAYFWSAIALAQGDENSKYRLEGLASQMTQTQVSAARQQAEAWIHQHNSARN